jgi:hypothetical protein
MRRNTSGIIVLVLLLTSATESGAKSVIGLDASTAELLRERNQAKTPTERAFVEDKITKLSALGFLRSSAVSALPKDMPAEHAQYHPHATKECDLLKPPQPGDEFDWVGHAEALMADAESCPICNPPKQDPPPLSSAAKTKAPRTQAPAPGRSAEKINAITDALNKMNASLQDEARKRSADAEDTKRLNDRPPTPTPRTRDGVPDLRAHPGDTSTTHSSPKTPTDWLVNDVKSMVNSKKYAQDAEVERFGNSFDAATPKCTLFIHDMLWSAGFEPPLRLYDLTRIGEEPTNAPITAAEWGNPDRNISGYPKVSAEDAKVGDVVAAVNPTYSNASGHGGFVSRITTNDAGERVIWVTSAGEERVTEKPLSEVFPSSSGYKSPVFRRPSRLLRSR